LPTKPRKRAPRGANRAAMLRAVEDRPGATSSELADTLLGWTGPDRLFGGPRERIRQLLGR